MNIKKAVRKIAGFLPSQLSVMAYRMIGAKIGRNVKLGRGCDIAALSIEIGDDAVIGESSRIKCLRLKIGRNTLIGRDADMRVAGDLSIGSNSVFKDGMKAYCRELIIGDHMYSCDAVDYGYSSSSHESRIRIGDHCFVGSRTVINAEREVTIGNDVGIGSEVMIWTHGSWLPVLKGFPANFAGVKIGSRAWIPSRVVILPGVEIGDDVVISINSVVNKKIPSGSLAAGNPAQIVKESFFPREYNADRKTAVIKAVLEDYSVLLSDKGLTADAGLLHPGAIWSRSFEKNKYTLIVTMGQAASAAGSTTVYDIDSMTMSGSSNKYSEDLRDYLRKRGIKFFTDKRFVSIMPLDFKKLEQI
ncbi:MAG: DapH/DapD/GlmU-related protein [Candidatus Margulisiibacteriota bacterium]